jgi:very-short-patch-repair endonuclease
MFRDIAPKGKPGSIGRARRLRREMTLPEILLWQVLRAKPGGLKFRRQDPSGEYGLDFYCSDARLMIEVDGEAHGRGDRPERDTVRDAWFAAAWIETLRVPAAEVLRDLDAVVRGVLAVATARLPLHHPAAPGGPPPRDELGEE